MLNADIQGRLFQPDFVRAAKLDMVRIMAIGDFVLTITVGYFHRPEHHAGCEHARGEVSIESSAALEPLWIDDRSDDVEIEWGHQMALWQWGQISLGGGAGAADGWREGTN